MEVILNNGFISAAMKNELDFLVFIGLSTGNIIRYIRNSGRVDDLLLAQILQATPQILGRLEMADGNLSTEWHKSLRGIFEN